MCMTSGVLLWNFVFLNGTPLTAIFNTKAKLSAVSRDLVTWDGLHEVNCDHPLLVMEEEAEVQPYCITWAQVRNQEVILDYDFTWFHFSNDSGQRTGFFMDQLGHSVPKKRPWSSQVNCCDVTLFFREDSKPSQPVTKICVWREWVLPPHLETEKNAFWDGCNKQYMWVNNVMLIVRKTSQRLSM